MIGAGWMFVRGKRILQRPARNSADDPVEIGEVDPTKRRVRPGSSAAWLSIRLDTEQR